MTSSPIPAARSQYLLDLDDGEKPGEDQPGIQDDEPAGLGHLRGFRAGWRWSRRAEMSMRGRLTEVIWDHGTASERRAR